MARRPRTLHFAGAMAHSSPKLFHASPPTDRRLLGELYDLSPAQLKTYERKAARLPGGQVRNLMGLLERRLDHVVFRLGLSGSIADARQLIRHGHIVVDGRRLSISSFLVGPGQHIEVHPTSRDRDKIRAAVTQGPRLPLPRFLERTRDGWGGAVRAPATISPARPWR